MDLTRLIVCGKEHEIKRSRLKRWFLLEEIRRGVSEAADRGDTGQVVGRIMAYLSAASDIPKEDLEKATWLEIARAYEDIQFLNQPRIRVPLFYTVSKEKKEPWDYEGRRWFYLANLIISCYHWHLDEVESLEIEAGMALVQEIFVDDQMRREWEWALSQNSIGYNANTKKSEFHPLERPEWMLPEAKMPKKTKILRSMLPVGLVVDKSGMDKYVQ